MNSFTIKKFKRNDEYIKNMLKNEIVYSDLAVFSEEYADFPVYVLHSEGGAYISGDICLIRLQSDDYT